MNSTITNGNGVEPDANALALERIKAEADRAGIRMPRKHEERDPYILAVARNKGAVRQDEHVADPGAMVKQLLDLAKRDDFYGRSPVGVAITTAAAVHSRMNADVHGVGELGPSSRISGARLAVGELLCELRDDPARARTLSPCESTLLAMYGTDEIREAVKALPLAIDAAHERVSEAVKDELKSPLYDGALPEPPPPLPEAVPMGRGLQLNPGSLVPVDPTTGRPGKAAPRVISAAELKESSYGL